MDNLFKKLLIVGVFFSSFVFGGFQSALKKPAFLSPEEAFKVEAVQKDDQIVTTITLADKIHIYKESLKFTVKGDNEVELDIIKPEAKKQEGEMIYEEVVKVTVPVEQILSKVSGDYTLSVEFQGCSDAGICYQPFTKSFSFKGKEVGVVEKIVKLSKKEMHPRS